MISRLFYWPALLTRTALAFAATLAGYALLLIAALISKASPARGLASEHGFPLASSRHPVNVDPNFTIGA
ncbi:MAG: hypothetical protein AAFY88_26130, partial [Acidobacteriota bacterium]